MTLILLRMSANSAIWGDSHRLALPGGALSFLIVLTPLQELDPARPDDTRGMALVGVATIAFLIWLWRRVRRNQRPPAPVEEANAAPE